MIVPTHLRRTLAFLFSTALIVLTACSPAKTPVVEGPSDECGPIEPSAEDVEFALSYSKAAFDPQVWVQSYTVEPYKISLTRRNDSESAIAYLEYLMFNCGYGQAELDDYFGEEGFNIIFGDYESHGLADFCEEEGLTLYEYDLTEDGAEYSARYWVRQHSDTRLLVTMLVFPSTSPSAMDSYAQKISPELTRCNP
jgi:hypothetical protein